LDHCPGENFEADATIRASAERKAMGDEPQALCFLAEADSFFIGEKLLTAENIETDKDFTLLKRLNPRPAGCDL
jgi:biotin synthase